MKNIHATTISYKKKGILIMGKSGSGKSDLAFRMIMQKGAKLVVDDRTDVENKNGRLIASSPATLQGLLEIRGVGIKHFAFVKKQSINLVVELSDKVERMPEEEFIEIEGVKLPKIKLCPFELSSLDKLLISL